MRASLSLPVQSNSTPVTHISEPTQEEWDILMACIDHETFSERPCPHMDAYLPSHARNCDLRPTGNLARAFG